MEPRSSPRPRRIGDTLSPPQGENCRTSAALTHLAADGEWVGTYRSLSAPTKYLDTGPIRPVEPKGASSRMGAAGRTLASVIFSDRRKPEV
jgi:hypothetical protein